MAKLSELRTLFAQAAARADAAAPARRMRSVPSQGAEPDVDLRQSFADVTPLAPRNRVPRSAPKPAPAAAQRMADENAALAASWRAAEPSPSSWDIGQEFEGGQTFVRPGIGRDVLARLRRGYWVVQGEIDLHRLTTGEARDALASFLASARARGWRCVRVVHGKGLTSPGREPVLKGKARKWLSQWDEVLAYSEAPRHAGGSGAVIVLLKAQS